MCRDLENANEKNESELRSSIIKPPRNDAINLLVYIHSYFFPICVYVKIAIFPQKEL